MKKIIILLFLLLNLIFCNNYFGSVSAYIENDSNNTFALDDIIDLKIITDNTNNTSVDLTALKQNFVIINQAQQVYHSIINGKASSKIQWVISLQSKASGSFTIPPIPVGNELTESINLNINPISTDPNKSQEIFINLETNNQAVYINTPLKLAVNVYVSTEITARNLQLNTPEGTEFSLFKISEENKQTFYKNQRYHLYQVQYLVFFSNTGTVSLPTFNLTGLKLKDTSRSHDILSLYQQQWLPFNRNSNPLAIKISEKPASFGSEPWLPADNIEIKQIWSNTNTTVNPGDALQRTIIINAQNAPANSLPALIDPTTAAPPNSNYKIYVDKPEITNEINNHKLSSSLIQKITYIPTNTGKLDIPSIKLSWWNNTTSSKIESQIDGKVYNIQPKNSTSPNNSSTVSLANSNEVNLQEPPVAITQNPPVLEATENANNPASLANKAINNDYYLLIIYILISLVLLLLIIIMIISRKIKNLTHLGRAFKHKGNVKNSDFIQHNTNLHSSLIHYIKLLKTNASNNDPNATYKTLCELIQKIYPEYNNISAFKRRLPENSQKALDELLSSLYSSSKNKWNNLGFIQTTIPSIQQQINMELTNRAKALQEVKNATLPELYP